MTDDLLPATSSPESYIISIHSDATIFIIINTKTKFMTESIQNQNKWLSVDWIKNTFRIIHYTEASGSLIGLLSMAGIAAVLL